MTNPGGNPAELSEEAHERAQGVLASIQSQLARQLTEHHESLTGGGEGDKCSTEVQDVLDATEALHEAQDQMRKLKRERDRMERRVDFTEKMLDIWEGRLKAHPNRKGRYQPRIDYWQGQFDGAEELYDQYENEWIPESKQFSTRPDRR
jgi:chromosome segregation ATPase